MKPPEAGDFVAVLASAAAPIAALAWGMTSGNPYGYFLFLRVVVCFGAFVFAAIAAGQGRRNLTVLFLGVVVLYNPLIPVHLTRDSWLVFNFATIAMFAYGSMVWLAKVRKDRAS